MSGYSRLRGDTWLGYTHACVGTHGNPTPPPKVGYPLVCHYPRVHAYGAGLDAAARVCAHTQGSARVEVAHSPVTTDGRGYQLHTRRLQTALPPSQLRVPSARAVLPPCSSPPQIRQLARSLSPPRAIKGGGGAELQEAAAER